MTDIIESTATLDVRAAAQSPSSRFAIQTSELTKRFGDVAVVDRLDLEVPTGSVFGFLGPNGSGKTTTIRMLLGLISPSEGQVQLLGRPIPSASDEVLPAVGALVEGPACYPWLTGRQNLERLDAAGPQTDPAPAERASTMHSSASGSQQPLQRSTGRTASACGNVSDSPLPCCDLVNC